MAPRQSLPSRSLVRKATETDIGPCVMSAGCVASMPAERPADIDQVAQVLDEDWFGWRTLMTVSIG